MINKEIISKSIDNAIYKSHQHLTLNDKVTATLDKFHKETINRKTEKGLLINDKGEIVHSKNGKKDEVDIWNGADERSLYEENGALHIEHNHPSVSKDFPFTECLSWEDTTCITHEVGIADGRGNLDKKYSIKSITAEGANDSRMTLVRGDFFSEKDTKLYDEACRELPASWNKYVEKFSEVRQNIYEKSVEDSKKKNGVEETIKNISEIDKESGQRAIKELGLFEKSDDFKSIQKKFREANCK